MLPGQPWKFDATVRLGASVVVCAVFMSACAVALIQYFREPQNYNTVYLGAVGGATALLGVVLYLLRRGWSDQGMVRTFGTLLASFYVGLLLIWIAGRFGSEADPASVPNVWKIVVTLVCFQGATVWLIHHFLREQSTGWVEAFGLRNSSGRAIGLGVLAGLAAVPLMGVMHLLSARLLELVGVPPSEQEAVQVLRAANTWMSRAVMGLTAIVFAPLAEELLFRGVLYPFIKQLGFPRIAVWLTAILFGLIHGNLGVFVPLTFFAMVLIWLYERTGNLAAPVAAHVALNTANFVMLFLLDPHSVVAPT
ncbi:MAG TPA: CPBP family intramembrane glutamic endopeptidase [Verrucomicrobiae bacterium]|nr:CPBP family intramembrane glutamic endopeptidase [Verrucomicrobiae bacterium]